MQFRYKMLRLLPRNVVFALFAVLQFYECKQQEQENPPRSVNLALETVLEFDNNENSADIKIIDKVQTFLKRVKSIIKKNKSYRRTNEDDGTLSFTDFIKSVLVVLSSYKDDDLEEIVGIIDEELRKYHYKGCKFYEIVENDNVRRYLSDQLLDLRTKNGKQLKHQLKDVIKKLTDENRGFKHKLICKYLDSLYTDEDVKNFNKFLHYIAVYRRKSKRSQINIIKIIREGLRRIIFDHYSKLDVDTRRDLRLKLETFWTQFSVDNSRHQDIHKFDSKSRSQTHRITFDETVEISSQDFVSSESIMNKHNKKKEQNKTIGIKKQKAETDRKETRMKALTKFQKITKSPKMTFITLYPEAITFLKQNIKRKRAHKKHKRINPIDTRRVTLLLRTKAPLKQLISDVKFMINVEGINMKSVDNARDADGGSRKDRASTKPYKSKKRKPIKKDNMPYSDEGLSIDIFHQSNEKYKYDGRPIRKSNDNDTLTIKPINDNTTTTATIVNEDVIKRINQLEIDLKDVKAHLAIRQIKSTTDKSLEEITFDTLDFWERTTAPTIKTFKKRKFKKTTTKITTTTKPSTTTTKTVTTKKVHHHHHKKNATKTTVGKTSTTTKFNTPHKAKSSGIFRSSDDVQEHYEVIPKTTTPIVHRFDLKSRGTKSVNATSSVKTTTQQHKTTTLSKVNEYKENSNVTKIVETTALNKVKIDNVTLKDNISYIKDKNGKLQDENDDIKDNAIKSDVENYLNDIKILDDGYKSQLVKQKMMEDLKSLMPSRSETRETLGTPMEPLSVAKLASTDDALDILDQDDILRK